MRLEREDRPFALLMGGCLAAFVVLLVLLVIAQSDYRDWCEKQGGHVDSSTHIINTVGVGSNGQPVVGVGSTTTYFCLTDDGRIIDVQ